METKSYNASRFIQDYVGPTCYSCPECDCGGRNPVKHKQPAPSKAVFVL